MKWMIGLYPKAWRARYGGELSALIEAEPGSLRLFVDLLGGAVDAHWNPQAAAREAVATSSRGGKMTVLKRCERDEPVSREHAIAGAVLTLGSALAIAGMLFLWNAPEAEAVALTMFPGVLAVGMQPHYLRAHSRVAKVALIGGMFLVLLAIGLVAAFLIR